MICSNALNSRGKPAVSPMSGSPTFNTEKYRNGAKLKLRHAVWAGGVKIRDLLLPTINFPTMGLR